MQQVKQIFAPATEDVWIAFNYDYAELGRLTDYHVNIEQDHRVTSLDIDVHLGGSAEGGYETTILTAPLGHMGDYRFSIQPQDIFSDISHLLGSKHIKLGYPEFDKELFIKTNDTERTAQLFKDEFARKVFSVLSGYWFGINRNKKTGLYQLELRMQRGVTNTLLLWEIYYSFHEVLMGLTPDYDPAISLVNQEAMEEVAHA
ncbi:hypothetical protein [Deminuibacter soli]|uniref:Uncharacterized protein n=1 Tax=Deminuibacter soli TaxID=2291815 RepID=A0A3E1NQ99_9BACT|nr:hypothetical protein [Deminuibacter soli]RFM30129.1 hypothetical protein DXN05_03910 [Deminuibacter soli]